jgi:hypothetical protein
MSNMLLRAKTMERAIKIIILAVGEVLAPLNE